MPFSNREYDAGQTQPESVLGMLRRTALLALQVFFLILLSIFPFKMLHFAEVRPAFLLMAVYYWSVFRPQLMSPAGAFAAGMLLDLLCAGPLGLNALTLLGMQALTGRQRKFLSGQSFVVLWLCFFLMAALACFFQWTVFSLFDLRLSPLRPLLVSAALTGLFFPPMAWILGALDKSSRAA
jgi:rod shape-determining protein MreD